MTALTHLDLPEWMLGDSEAAQSIQHSLISKTPATVRRELREMQYEPILERILDRIAEGTPLSECLRDDVREIEPATFLRWIHKDSTRKNRYYEAQEIGAEMVAAQILTIADGTENPLEDVQRSKLRIDSRRFLLQVWNRKRFGEKVDSVTANSGAVNIYIEGVSSPYQLQQGAVIDQESVDG